MLQINVLGPLGITPEPGSILPRKLEALIACMVIMGRTKRIVVADLLWPDQKSDQSRHSLRNCLLESKKTYGLGEHIRSDYNFVWIENFSTDIEPFMAVPDKTQTRDLLAAADLYRGPFLENFEIKSEPFEEWVAVQRRRCSDQAESLLMRLTGSAEPSVSIPAGHRLMALVPLSEDGCREMLRACCRAGRRVTGLRAYKAHAAALWRDLQVKPSPETQAIADTLMFSEAPPEVVAA